MAYSFYRIEREKSRFLAVLSTLLVVVYFLTIYIVWVGGRLFFFTQHFFRSSSEYVASIELLSLLPSLNETLLVLLFSLCMACFHLFFSLHNLTKKVLFAFGAEDINLEYGPHKMFKNIIEEVCVAVGGADIEGRVINSGGLNAFSVSDYGGKAYIGVTEGLLVRLSRSQLEAVVGHEAAHIASGDSLLVSVACSMFGLYGSIFEKIQDSMGSKHATAFSVFLFIVIGIMKSLNKLIVVFISQQKVFKADAAAVRLTRNPLALAQGLYIISKSWQGRFTGTEGLFSLCIAQPESWTASGSWTETEYEFSSHPPIEERIDILLNMAHADKSSLEDMLKNIKQSVKVARKTFSQKKKKEKELKTQKGWFVLDKNKWQGPFLLKELHNLGWLSATHLVRKDGALLATKAFEDNDLAELFKESSKESLCKFTCPSCYHGLAEMNYEGAKAYKCPACKGILVEWHNVKKILIREDQSFRKEIVDQAQRIKAQEKDTAQAIKQLKTPFIFNCPKCQKKMRRKLFSTYAPVEVDMCSFCATTWFDVDELEITQILYDQLPDKDFIIG